MSSPDSESKEPNLTVARLGVSAARLGLFAAALTLIGIIAAPFVKKHLDEKDRDKYVQVGEGDDSERLTPERLDYLLQLESLSASQKSEIIHLTEKLQLAEQENERLISDLEHWQTVAKEERAKLEEELAAARSEIALLTGQSQSMSPDAVTPEATLPDDPDTLAVYGGIRYELTSATNQGGVARFDFDLTAIDEKTWLDWNLRETRIFTPAGDEIYVARMRVGSNTGRGSTLQQEMPANVKVNASIEFHNVPTSLNRIAHLEIGNRSPSGSVDFHHIPLRTLPLVQPRVNSNNESGEPLPVRAIPVNEGDRGKPVTGERVRRLFRIIDSATN